MKQVYNQKQWLLVLEYIKLYIIKIVTYCCLERDLVESIQYSPKYKGFLTDNFNTEINYMSVSCDICNLKGFVKDIQLVTKIIGKTAIWTISYFYRVAPLNNFEKQWTKLASSYMIGLQHCLGGEKGFLNTIFKIPIIFCHWLLGIQQVSPIAKCTLPIPSSDKHEFHATIILEV